MVRCDLSPDHFNNERFEQLCALAAIGELSAAEFSELNEHLAGCSKCQQVYVDFRRIASTDLGAVAAGRRVNDAAPELDESGLLTRVLERVEAAKVDARAPDFTARHHSRPRPRPLLLGLWGVLRSPMLATTALVFLVCAVVGTGAYRLRDQQLAPKVVELGSRLSQQERETRIASAQASSSSAMLQQSQSEQEALRRALAEAHKDYADILKRDQVLEMELAASKQQLEHTGSELLEARATAQHSDSSLKDLQARFQDALARTHEQESTVDQLQRKLRRSEEETAAANGSAIPDVDGKEVFGARDLHIVDVYDVDAGGKTKRSFGRVYFVEKKLLLFYAFDLQDRQRQPQYVAAAFQAWGYRQGNEGKPQNLGLFLMDDPAVSRWVLKVNNARVLERIDAVFVTLEPPKGSTSPSGRRLLYANLGGPPNHP
jgi:hypothetical protein